MKILQLSQKLPALKNLLFQKESYHTARFESAEFAERLKTILTKETFDIIQLESIFVSRYLDILPEAIR